MYLGDWRLDQDVFRRVAVTFVALCAVQVLPNIPLPGIDGGAFRAVATLRDAPSYQYRLSMGALDVVPLFIAWTIYEVWRTIFETRADGTAAGLRRLPVEWLILPVAMALTAQEAYDLARSLEGKGGGNSVNMAVAPGLLFELSTGLTLMAATALLAWLASVITRHGVGSGLWVLVVAGAVQQLPSILGAQKSWPILILLVASAMALVVLDRAASDTPRGPVIDLWCPVIATTASPYVVRAIAFIAAGGNSFTEGYFNAQVVPAYHIEAWTVALLAGALSMLRAVRFGTATSLASHVARSLPAAMVIAIICFAADVVTTADGQKLPGDLLIPLVLTALAISRALKSTPPTS